MRASRLNFVGSNTCGARSVDSSTPESDGSSLLPSRPTCVSTGRVYRAVYAYDAQDPEEVSFDEGDLLIGERYTTIFRKCLCLKCTSIQTRLRRIKYGFSSLERQAL